LAHIALELLGLIAHSVPAEVRDVSLHCLHLPFDHLPHSGHPGLGLAGPLGPAIAWASSAGFRPLFPGDFVGPAEHLIRISGDLVSLSHFSFGAKLLGFRLQVSAFLPQLIGTRLVRRHDAGHCHQRD
jgi:hypothetical protein